MIDHSLSILIINNNKAEIRTIKTTIRSFAPNSLFVIAHNVKSLEKRINWLDYHMVICDHQLPNDQAQRANLRLRIQVPHLPFILITSCAEMNRGLFAKRSSSWSVRAVIDREQLANSGKVFQSVYNNCEQVVEQERCHRLKTKQRNLLLQKFDCLLKQALQPINAFKLEELSKLLFGPPTIVEHFTP